jgi:hypothetical protein
MESRKEIDSAHEEMRTKHTELCTAIGAYIVSFENLMTAIRYAIHELLKREGLSNMRITDMLAADLTADPLFKKFDGLLSMILTEEYNDPIFKKRYTTTYNGIMEDIVFRNRIAHTHWHIAFKFDHETKKASTQLSGNLLRYRKGKGAENHFENADYTIIDELKKRTNKTYFHVDLVHEIIINIREKQHLNRVWLEEYIE